MYFKWTNRTGNNLWGGNGNWDCNGARSTNYPGKNDIAEVSEGLADVTGAYEVGELRIGGSGQVAVSHSLRIATSAVLRAGSLNVYGSLIVDGNVSHGSGCIVSGDGRVTVNGRWRIEGAGDFTLNVDTIRLESGQGGGGVLEVYTDVSGDIALGSVSVSQLGEVRLLYAPGANCAINGTGTVDSVGTIRLGGFADKAVAIHPTLNINGGTATWNAGTWTHDSINQTGGVSRITTGVPVTVDGWEITGGRLDITAVTTTIGGNLTANTTGQIRLIGAVTLTLNGDLDVGDTASLFVSLVGKASVNGDVHLEGSQIVAIVGDAPAGSGHWAAIIATGSNTEDCDQYEEAPTLTSPEKASPVLGHLSNQAGGKEWWLTWTSGTS